MGLTSQDFPNTVEKERAIKRKEKKKNAVKRLLRIVAGKDQLFLACADRHPENYGENGVIIRGLMDQTNEVLFEAIWRTDVGISMGDLREIYEEEMAKDHGFE